jgi:hypothetical protein
MNIGGNAFTELNLSVIGDLPELKEFILQLEPRTTLIDMQVVSVSVGAEQNDCMEPRHQLKLDLTPLFWCGSLESVVVVPTDVPYAEILLKHIALSQTKNNRSIITSAPDSMPSPAMLWLDSSFAERIHWINYHTWNEDQIPSLVSQLEDNLEHFDRIFWFHAQKGMMEGLGLSWISGYDGSPLDLLEFKQDPTDIKSLQEQVSQTAANLLTNQVRNGGPTLFINVDDLIANGLLDLASEIVEARKNEFQNMRVPVHDGYASIAPLLLSDYGLRMCREVGIRQIRIKESLFENLRNALVAAGLFVERVEVKSVRDFQDNMPRISKSLANFVLRYYVRTL